MTDTTVPDQREVTTAIETVALHGVVVNKLSSGNYLVSGCRLCKRGYVSTFEDSVALSRQVSKTTKK